MKKIILFSLFTTLFVKSLFGFSIDVDVLNKYFKPIPVLGLEFYSTSNTKKYADILLKDVSELLSSSGVIDITLTNNDLLKDFVQNNDIDFSLLNPQLSNYSNYQYSIVGKVVEKQAGDIEIEISIFNNIINKSVRAFAYVVPKSVILNKLDAITKNISNEIYVQIAKAQGYFEDSLLYTNGKELLLADYLGNNKKTLLSVDGQIYAPIFSPDRERIIYVLFKNGISEIYIYTLATKSNVRLAKLKGLSLSPVLSKDNQTLLFAVMSEGASNIFSYNFLENKLRQLTNSYSINLPGDFSADGETILFNSDRTGSPQIYTMNKFGKRIKKISQGKGAYYTPSFAPNRDIILYTNLQNKRFSIGVLSLSGNEKIISKEKLVESPRWVNDRTVAYQYVYAYDKKGKPLYAFYMLDILSGYKINIQPEYNSEDPSFSHGNLQVDDVVENKQSIKTYNLSSDQILFFKVGSLDVLEDYRTFQTSIIVSDLILYLKDHPNKKVSIIGYSEDKEEEINKNSDFTFSSLRVQKLKKYLLSKGVSENQISHRDYKGNANSSNKVKNSNNNAHIELLITNTLDNNENMGYYNMSNNY